MYLWNAKKSRTKRRGKTARFRAKLKAKNRRRVNRVHGRAIGRR